MSFTLYTASPNAPKFPYVPVASTAMTTGSLMYRDITNKVIKEATSSAGLITNIEAVSTKTQTTDAASTPIECIPVIPFAQLWIADCTSNTAANQLNIAHALTDARTVANTSTHVATTLGVFVAVALVGAATDKKLLGYFVKTGQVTA